MGRVLALLKPLSKLHNPWTYRALAVLLVVSTTASGGYMIVQKFRRQPAEGTPTKKVVTGLPGGETPASDLAAAALQPPTTLAPSSSLAPPSTTAPNSSKYGDYGQYSYGSGSSGDADSAPVNPYRQVSSETEQPTTAPPTNPYGYGGYGSTGEASPAEVQAAGAEPANQPPLNPYAISDDSSADPTGAAVPETAETASSPAAAPPTEAPIANQPPASPYGAAVSEAVADSDPSAGYANPYAQAVPTTAPPTTAPVEQPSPAGSPSAIPLPPNTLSASSQIAPSQMDSAPSYGAAAANPAPGNSLQPLDASPAPLGGSALGSAATSSSLAPQSLSGMNTVAGEGVGIPGDRHLEGLQAPAITIEKIAPPEVQIGKQATIELRVRNVGQTPAANVVVTDHVPRGATLVDAKPEYTRSGDGGLAWNLGTMQPGTEVAIQMQIMPQSEGEIGSVAQVAFAAQATSRSVCTRPLVSIEHTAPPKVMIGQPLTVAITVSNPGTGAATGLVIEEDVPEGLVHAAGSELEYEIGTLRPGETKRLELSLKADKAGIIENTILVRGEGNLSASHRLQIEVVAPQLQVDVNGPKKRFLQRQATYTVQVANPGTAAARDVELVAFLPRGMKFVETDSQGQYDPQQHAVFWSLEELPAAKTGAVTFVTVPVEAGEQRLRVEGKADLGLAVANEQTVQVDAAAELRHTITDLSDPIEVGSATAYEIRVTNTGTKTATNVRVAAVVPAEMKLISGEGPTQGAPEGQQIVFQPLPRLNPQEEAVFKVHAQGLRPGDHIIRVQLASDEWPTPVSREESTRVYEDQ